MMERLQLLGMTSLLTLLIWLTADSLVNEEDVLRVEIDVLPRAKSDLVVDRDPGVAAQLYEVRVSGPRRLIDDVRAWESPRLKIRIDERPPGPTMITLDHESLKQALVDRMPDCRRLSVAGVEPNSIPVVLDRMVQAEAEIVLKGLSLAYEVEPRPSRSTVEARLRESRLTELVRGGPRLQLDIAPEVERQLRGKPVGQSVTVTVALDNRSFGSDSRILPSTIEVTATVKSQRTAAEIPTVPIKLAVSFSNLATAYHAVGRDGARLELVTQSIHVVGSQEDMARLVRGDTRAYGLIQMKDTDFQQMGMFRAWVPTIILPPGVELDRPPTPVEFKLIASTEPGPTTGPGGS